MLSHIEVLIQADPAWQEILIAELSQLGYDTFIEEENALAAYIPEPAFDPNSLSEVLQSYQPLSDWHYSYQAIAPQNWNAQWEAAYQPVLITEKCLIKSRFHQVASSYPYEITIDPKMSFGTGHHETTSLMVENQLEIDHSGKRVIDAGCGTGVLAILAEKRGAAAVLAFDVEDWAIRNCTENIALNGCHRIHLFQGTIRDVPEEETYDIVLANINRNVLLEEMAAYQKRLKVGGVLVISGFYEKDSELISQEAARISLSIVNTKTKNNWQAIVLGKH
ncbi:MAG: 50S ribosomal protein L11 methyltransferase [Bacteroidia bacterium]|nr:50S ribosomal protein L11 methyltransferase [Bacteroidia bacterium]